MTWCTRTLTYCMNSSLSVNHVHAIITMHCLDLCFTRYLERWAWLRHILTLACTRWTGCLPQKPYHLSISHRSSSYLLLVSLLCSFVLCLPCLCVCPCLQQLKPGWSLSRLASTANLRIVPFIRLAPSHNKTSLSCSLKSVQRRQCEKAVIAFEWTGMITLIYFL